MPSALAWRENSKALAVAERTVAPEIDLWRYPDRSLDAPWPIADMAVVEDITAFIRSDARTNVRFQAQI